MAKRRIEKRKRKKGDARRARPGKPHPVSHPGPEDGAASVYAHREALWAELRQGARNVAGVRFQTAVAGHLLTLARQGVLPFVSVIPEGLEDIDCRGQGHDIWHVQAKEVGAGAGRFTASNVAEVITHAAVAADSPEARIVAITDAKLGAQLRETGWEGRLDNTPEVAIGDIKALLVARGHPDEDARDLLRRTHLLQLPWNLAPLTISCLARTFDLKDSVASLVYSKMIEDLTLVSADQRSTTAETAIKRSPGDLDSLVTAVLNVVDLNGLDAAISAGVCAPADYNAISADDLVHFLHGVDTIPAHIGSRFDVLRPREMRHIQKAVESDRYALIAGPSGAGKSTLLWRAARDTAPGARIVRVLRVETASDADKLIRHARLLSASEMSPVIIGCDDLGRPHMSEWTRAARGLLEIPYVFIMGAVRYEDLTPNILRHGGMLVEIALDEETTRTIAETLTEAGIELKLEIQEAVSAAEGQLMELLALLTTGRRLSAVLADQVEGLYRHQRHTEITLARTICAAHVLGVDIQADKLTSIAVSSTQDVTAALKRLQNEHIILEPEGSTWRGLHQKRSDELTNLFHATPPPTFSTTIASIIPLLSANGAGWATRRATELLDHDLTVIAEAASSRVCALTSAREVAATLEGLERADNTLLAKQCLPIIRRYLRSGVSVSQLSMMVTSIKYSEIRFTLPGAEAIQACANELPNRSSPFVATAVKTLGAGSIVDIAIAAPLADAVRLLEAVEHVTRMNRTQATHIAESFAQPVQILAQRDRALRARLIASVYQMLDAKDDACVAFGTIEERLVNFVQAYSNTVSARTVQSDGGVSAQIRLLHDFGERSTSQHFEWDARCATESNNNSLNHSAVEIAKTVADACPELQFVEVRTVGPSGQPLLIGGLEPGHKRLDRQAIPRQAAVRFNVGLNAALARLESALSWTELVRQRSETAQIARRLIVEAPRRLSLNDHVRRRQSWHDAVVDAQNRLARIPKPPPVAQQENVESAASVDHADRRDDKIVSALSNLMSALPMVDPARRSGVTSAAVACRIEDARKMLLAAQEGQRGIVMSGEPDQYREIDSAALRLHGVLIAIDRDSALARFIRGRDAEFLTNIDNLIQDSSTTEKLDELTVIEGCLDGISGVSVQEVADPESFAGRLCRHQWIAVVDAEWWEDVLHCFEQWPSNGWPLAGPKVSLVCKSGGRIVPIGARLMSSGSASYLPMQKEDVAALAEALGFEVLTSDLVEWVGTTIEAITLISWEYARKRLRPQEWPRAAWVQASSVLQLKSDVELRLPNTGAMHGLCGELREVLLKLIERVEESGQASDAGSLANALWSRDPVNDWASLAASPEWQEVNRATLLSIEIELEASE